MTRQTFSWTAMSTRIETRIAKAKAAPSWAVKTVVWVMKPGPMALVAIRNIAPSERPALAGARGCSRCLVSVSSLLCLVVHGSMILRCPSVGEPRHTTMQDCSTICQYLCVTTLRP